MALFARAIAGKKPELPSTSTVPRNSTAAPPMRKSQTRPLSTACLARGRASVVMLDGETICSGATSCGVGKGVGRGGRCLVMLDGETICSGATS